MGELEIQKKASQFEKYSHLDRTLRCELAIAPIIESGQSIGVRCSFVLYGATATARIFRERLKSPLTLALTKNNAGGLPLSRVL